MNERDFKLPNHTVRTVFFHFNFFIISLWSLIVWSFSADLFTHQPFISLNGNVLMLSITTFICSSGKKQISILYFDRWNKKFLFSSLFNFRIALRVFELNFFLDISFFSSTGRHNKKEKRVICPFNQSPKIKNESHLILIMNFQHQRSFEMFIVWFSPFKRFQQLPSNNIIIV